MPCSHEGKAGAMSKSRWIGVAVFVLVAGGAATAGALTGTTGGAAAQPAAVSVFPSPGTISASAGTQISLRGAAPDQIGTVTVTGSRSGEVAGELKPHSDGKGASFVLAKRLRGGERVTVRTGLSVRGGREGDYTFTVGRRPAPRQVNDGTLPLPTLPPAATDSFRSNPDLESPVVRITQPARGTAPGYVLMAPFSPKGSPNPDGPMIVDDRGDLVWFNPLRRGTAVTDLKVQELDGRRVLTWWEGRFALGWGYGEYPVLDESYREIARIGAANGYRADLHDLTITPEGTALVMVYDRVFADLRSVGGVRRGTVLDNVVQEIDLKTGLVLFEWHSVGRVALNDSRERPRGRESWDYFHSNSIEVDTDGNLLVSARNTCAVYKIDRTTGALIWTLGGEESDFRLNRRTRFCFQHDARRAAPGVITLFDNSAGPPNLRRQSRGVKLAVDERRRTVRLVEEYQHPARILAPTQGSTRVLPNGNVFVGWGAAPVFTEFSANGRPLFNGRLTKGKGNYRAIRAEWTGRPSTPPDIATQRRGNRLAVFASWNGATEVARWEALTGASEAALQPAGSARRAGFETALSVPAGQPFVAVRALDSQGNVLGTSRVVRASG
jgi:Arylsulfotransferase (ASST)